MILSYTIKNSDDYSSVRNVLRTYFQVSTRLLMKLKNLDLVFLNGKSCRLDDTVHIDDCVSFSLDFVEDNSNIVPTSMNLDIKYEDEALIVINKPPCIAIHPTSYHYSDTLSNGIKYYYDSINLPKKIRPVNRLDRNTSGLVVFAKNEYVQELLIRQMSDGIFKKLYIGFVDGILENKFGIINAPISRKEGSIIERKIDERGFSAKTHYTVLCEYQNFSKVKFELETGRTHQIRVHCKHIGHPLLGDTLYGVSSELINRQALHSYYISFIHPITKKVTELTSPLPYDMQQLEFFIQ